MRSDLAVILSLFGKGFTDQSVENKTHQSGNVYYFFWAADTEVKASFLEHFPFQGRSTRGSSNQSAKTSTF